MKKVGIIILLLIGVLKAQADCTTGTVATPIIDSVSVNAAGDVVVCWQTVVDPNLDHYDIWTIDNTGANLLIGVVAAGVTCFTYPAAANNSGIQTVQILIVAVDNCPAPGPFSSNFNLADFVSTIFLEENFNKCSSSVELSWTPYEGFISPFVRYDIFVSINGAPSSFVSSTFSTSFNYLGISASNTYEFYVTAIEKGGLGPFKSTSNFVSSSVLTALKYPNFNYLNNVTVIDSQQVDVQFLIDTTASVSSYNIQRANSATGNYITIDSVRKFQGMDTIVVYSDVALNTNSTSYFYRIEIINDCNVGGNISNIGSTILINVSSSPIESTNTLTISDYKDWDLGVLRYDIYRATGGIWELSPVNSLPSFTDDTTYVDDISEVFTGNGDFCYKVVAVSKGVPAFAKSSSNEACAIHNPLVYIPNAFSPRGIYNTGFKPILTFADPKSYTFKIFNRWGFIVFETSDVTEVWNGRFNNTGKFRPSGVYVYVLNFKSADGTTFSKKGSVTLLN